MSKVRFLNPPPRELRALGLRRIRDNCKGRGIGPPLVASLKFFRWALVAGCYRNTSLLRRETDKQWGIADMNNTETPEQKKAGLPGSPGEWIQVINGNPRPELDGSGPSVQVLGIISDSKVSVNGDSRFVEIVAYWPSTKLWTATFAARGSEDYQDFSVTVTHWQPLPEVPPC
jgi:hypothetical protein